MTTFKITMSGISGEYQADTRAQALDLFAQDAGYKTWADAVAQGLASDDEVQVTE